MAASAFCFSGLSPTAFAISMTRSKCGANSYIKQPTRETRRDQCSLLSSLEQPSPQRVVLHDALVSLHVGTDTAWGSNHQHIEASSESKASPITYDGGTDGGSSGSGGFGGGRDRGSGDSDGINPNDESLPEDMKAALLYGSLTRDALNRYYKGLANPFTKLLLGIPAFRSRFLMDASFLFKLLVQEVIGNGTALASEIAVRGKDIVHEMEYVVSDLIVGTVIEAAFVWLLAPTLSLPSTAASPISKYLSSLPAHFFQPSTAVRSFTITQRIVSFFYAAMQYGAIGFAGGIVGTAITYALLEGRKCIDKNYKPFRPMPPVIPNSGGWAAFMALSSNTRFQLVEGLEMGVAKLLSGTSSALLNTVIVTIRFINNYWGGVQFVKFFRAIGLHATGDEEDRE